MSDGSATAYLLWALLASLFQAFLLYHLWCYDRFKCLRWDAGRQPGAFKRVMTYSYTTCVPLLMLFAVGMTVVKFRAGEIVGEDGYIGPKPIQLWSKDERRWLIPLYIVFSLGWGLEIVTHLEELVFWLFLLHQSGSRREWFESWEFRTWYMGSTVAILGMPITALITRRNIETCISYIFVTGGAASTLTTVAFIYVLWRFPAFLAHVKAEGADPDVVVRLATHYQLNIVRVLFRFMFTLPLLVLGADVISGSMRVVRSNVAVDLCLLLTAIGSFFSSAITVLIFFPRSITREAGYKPRPPSSHRNTPTLPTLPLSPLSPPYSPVAPSSPASPTSPTSPTSANGDAQQHPHFLPPDELARLSFRAPPAAAFQSRHHAPRLHTHPRRPSAGASGSGGTPSYDMPSYGYTGLRRASTGASKSAPVEGEGNGQAQGQGVHPYALTFTSPIDLPEEHTGMHPHPFPPQPPRSAARAV